MSDDPDKAVMHEAAQVIVAKVPYTELAKIIVDTYEEADLEAFMLEIDTMLACGTDEEADI